MPFHGQKKHWKPRTFPWSNVQCSCPAGYIQDMTSAWPWACYFGWFGFVNLFTLSCAAFKHHGTTPLCLLNWQTLQSRCTSSVPTRTLNTRRNSTLHMTKVVDAHSLDPQPHWIGQLESTKSMQVPFPRKWLCLWTLWAKQSIQMHSNSRHVKTAKDISCHTYWQTRKDGRCRLEWPISDKNTKTPQGIGWTWPCKKMWNTPPRF